MTKHWRRRGMHARTSEQQSPRPVVTTDAVGITDARTRVEHLVSDKSTMTHRHAGNYLALCGARVLAASLTEPSRSRCPACVQ